MFEVLRCDTLRWFEHVQWLGKEVCPAGDWMWNWSSSHHWSPLKDWMALAIHPCKHAVSSLVTGPFKYSPRHEYHRGINVTMNVTEASMSLWMSPRHQCHYECHGGINVTMNVTEASMSLWMSPRHQCHYECGVWLTETTSVHLNYNL